MVEMLPRIVPTSRMDWRQSADATVYHYRYNEPNVMYNQPLVTYNYTTYRGEMGVRIVQSPQMRGK